MQQATQPDYDAAKLEAIQKAPLIIAVAGHANHGKTSVIRTLCRMPEFGEVSDFPGTTKRVSGVPFKIVNRRYMIIFDTPGFQNLTAVIEECGEPFTI
jgi:GTP-binding protein EngB required for normal cell division